MVQPKGTDDRNWLTRMFEDFDRDHPIIATRYYVAEVTPGRSVRIPNGDGHGGTTYDWEGPTETIVSPYSEDETICQTFIKEHDPDEGKTLEVRSQHLRQFTTERWM